METTTLSQTQPEFTITGREEKMSVEILKVALREPEISDLKLIISDENGFVLYTKKLEPEPVHPNAVLVGNYPEVAVNKRFIFSAFLTVKIESESGSAFSAEVFYV